MPIQRAKPKFSDVKNVSIAASTLPAGSIIQYVEGVSLSATVSDSTGSFVDSGITLTITPTSASSKIYLSLKKELLPSSKNRIGLIDKINS